jgi:hypothetical protein
VPGAQITWDLASGAGGGAVVAGFVDTTAIDKLQALGLYISAAPDNTLTIPTGATGIPTAAQNVMISAWETEDSDGSCVAYLCGGTQPIANVDWDMTTPGGQTGDSFIVAGMDSANKASMLQSFAKRLIFTAPQWWTESDPITIPSGAVTIPLTTERTVLTAITALDDSSATCYSNLCTNAPSAQLTWDLQTGNSAGDSVVIPGFFNSARADRLQAFALRLQNNAADPITLPAGAMEIPLATERTVLTAITALGSTCYTRLCTSVPTAAITWDTQTDSSDDGLVVFGVSANAANRLQKFGKHLFATPCNGNSEACTPTPSPTCCEINVPGGDSGLSTSLLPLSVYSPLITNLVDGVPPGSRGAVVTVPSYPSPTPNLGDFYYHFCVAYSTSCTSFPAPAPSIR